jgi:hypothetical protein
MLARLRAKGIATVTQLLERLPGHVPTLASSLLSAAFIRAWPVLIELMSDRSTRAPCADVLSRLKSRGRATEYFLDTGRRELSSSQPDRFQLEALTVGPFRMVGPYKSSRQEPVGDEQCRESPEQNQHDTRLVELR